MLLNNLLGGEPTAAYLHPRQPEMLEKGWSVLSDTAKAYVDLLGSAHNWFLSEERNHCIFSLTNIYSALRPAACDANRDSESLSSHHCAHAMGPGMV